MRIIPVHVVDEREQKRLFGVLLGAGWKMQWQYVQPCGWRNFGLSANLILLDEYCDQQPGVDIIHDWTHPKTGRVYTTDDDVNFKSMLLTNREDETHVREMRLTAMIDVEV